MDEHVARAIARLIVGLNPPMAMGYPAIEYLRDDWTALRAHYRLFGWQTVDEVTVIIMKAESQVPRP